MSVEVVPFSIPTSAGVEELRAFIQQIEDFALANGEQIEIPIEHYFSKDVYAREMKLKADTFLIGKIHRHQNLNILSEGEVSVLSVDGIKRVKAPHTFVSSPGAKRVIYAHTPVTWTTIHGTNEKDLDKIESEFIAKTYDDVVPLLEGAKEKK